MPQFKCNHCDHVAKSYSGMYGHIKAKHPKVDIAGSYIKIDTEATEKKQYRVGEENYECLICHKKFGTDGGIYGHLKKQHLDDPRPSREKFIKLDQTTKTKSVKIKQISQRQLEIMFIEHNVKIRVPIMLGTPVIVQE